MPATLYIVATPIGNLSDLSPRAASTLASVAAIACEDTRQTRKLLDHLAIQRPLLAFHEHNERERTPELIARLQAGESLALVSDAGTPLISDPGYRLIDAAIAAGIAVVPIPGPCAAIAALSASGLPTDAFYFGGFFHSKPAQRRKQLEAVADLPATLIFYEAPHRIEEALGDIDAVLGARRLVLARELTKLHEEFLRGTPGELRTTLAARPAVKGEFTVLIGKGDAASTAEAAAQVPLAEAVAALEAQGLPRMDAIKQAARERGLSKRDAYRMLHP